MPSFILTKIKSDYTRNFSSLLSKFSKSYSAIFHLGLAVRDTKCKRFHFSDTATSRLVKITKHFQKVDIEGCATPDLTLRFSDRVKVSFIDNFFYKNHALLISENKYAAVF